MTRLGGHELRPRDAAFPREPADLALSRLQGRQAGHVQQPGGEGLRDPDRSGPAVQDEERRLEGVLGRRGVAQHAAAAGQHGRPVSREDRLEGRLGRLVAPGDAIEELGFGQAHHAPAVEQLPQVPPDHRHLDAGHRHPSDSDYRLPSRLFPRSARPIQFPILPDAGQRRRDSEIAKYPVPQIVA